VIVLVHDVDSVEPNRRDNQRRWKRVSKFDAQPADSRPSEELKGQVRPDIANHLRARIVVRFDRPRRNDNPEWRRQQRSILLRDDEATSHAHHGDRHDLHVR
jgi:hypothetical protein